MLTPVIQQISQQFLQFYKHAEHELNQTFQQFSISESFLNATIEKYATDNVGAIKDLHLNAFDGWLRLFCSVDVLGNHFDLSVDLKLVKTSINEREQLFVFEQISDTQVIHANYANGLYKIAIQSALFFFRRILRKDPLGFVLAQLHKKWDIGINQYDGLFHLDIMRWLKKYPDILKPLAQVNIVDASLVNGALVAKAKTNFQDILKLQQKLNAFL